MVSRTIVIICVAIVLVAIFTFYLVSNIWLLPKKFGKFDYTQKQSRFPEGVIKNPDILYPNPPGGLIKNLASHEWRGVGLYFYGTLYFDGDGRSGIAVIHPENTTLGRYIEQDVVIPKGKKYVLKVGIADIAGDYEHCNCAFDIMKIEGDIKKVCNDVGFKIKIIDDAKRETILYDGIANIKEGWKDLSLDLGDTYSGKNVTIRVESYAGGPCGDWAGEWAAVDYVYLQEL